MTFCCRVKCALTRESSQTPAYDRQKRANHFVVDILKPDHVASKIHYKWHGSAGTIGVFRRRADVRGWRVNG
jgi:hypothetical protein